MDEQFDITDFDRDALHVLPLAAIEIETKGLRNARLLKNNRIHSVVEMFRGESTGSGQLEIENLHYEFGWTPSDPPSDLTVLRKLAGLHSYDVYSLRISLRELGIQVNDIAALQLSDAKKAELTQYMKVFTEPLIKRIYGSDGVEINEFTDVISLFSDPDIIKDRERLMALAKELQIRLTDVPHFLEDFGDVFLSLSYYRSCMDQLGPMVDNYSRSVDELEKSYQFKSNQMLMDTSRIVETTIVNLLTAIGGRLETFERNTQDMWQDMSAAKFRQVKNIIQGYHKIIGGSLCALSVKMDAWTRQFPNVDVGGPSKRSEFIMSEMKEGIDKLREIQTQALSASI